MTHQADTKPLLARIQTRIILQMTKEAVQNFPDRLRDATVAGADLRLVPWKLVHRVASDTITARADAHTAALCAPALDIVRRWSEGETVSRDEADEAYRGLGEYTSEDEIDKDPVNYDCKVIARCTNPHHDATWHTTDVVLSMSASMASEGASRADAYDAFGELVLDYVKAAGQVVARDETAA